MALRLIGAIMALFLATSAHAGEWRVIHGGSTSNSFPANNMAFDADGSKSLTGSFASGVQMIRAVCSTACYIAVAQTGSTGPTGLKATTATGVYMGIGIPMDIRVSSGETIAVIGVSTGVLSVHELTK